MIKVELPKKPDEDILQLLMRAKLFLEHATMHSETDASFDRMIAIHNLDNYIEYVLRIIIRHVQIEEATGKNLETSEIAKLAGEVNKYLKNTYSMELPYVSEIKLLRQVRNLVQHAMVDPASDLPRLLKICQRFFDKVLNSIFGITSKEIRISSIIQDDDVRKHLKNAEQFIANKQYLKAVVACRDAFENAKFVKMKNSSLKIDFVPALLEAKKNLRYLYSYLKRLNLELEFEKHGIEYRLYQKFDDYIQHIPYEYCSDWNGNTVMQRPWNKDDALFCYSFVSDIIYKWQDGTTRPLYEVESFEYELSLKEFIGGIELKSVSDGGCEYLMSENENMRYLFVGSETNKMLLENIFEKSIYEIISESYIDGKLKSRSYEFVEVLAIDSNLVTNTPSRWELLIWMKKIPLTYYREKLEDNEWVIDYLDISKADYNDLIEFGLPQNIIEVILYPRKNALSISRFEHAKQIREAMLREKIRFNRDIYFRELIDSLRNGDTKSSIYSNVREE